MRCGAKEKKHFLMPRGLRYIRELAKEGIDWRGLHMVDAVSLYCAIQIDRARRISADQIAGKNAQGGNQKYNAGNRGRL